MMFMLIYRLGFELYVWFDDKIYIERYYEYCLRNTNRYNYSGDRSVSIDII